MNQGADMTSNYRKDPDAVSRLTPEQYRITQKNGTEPPFRNEYWDNKEPGIYVDVVSGEPLFASVNKFDSHTGWPSFSVPIEPGNVAETREGCATASTPRPCASSRSTTWSVRDTAPTASYSSPPTTQGVRDDERQE